MKYSFLGMALIMGGLIGIIFISMFQSITIDNEAEYYVLKEAREAAMLESVDKVCYRNNSDESKQNGCGKVIKITEQKFVENFTRRFAASINGDIKEYEIQFYDIIESPPKASVVINGLTEEYFGEEKGFNIVNSLSGILETDVNGEKLEDYLDNRNDHHLDLGNYTVDDSGFEGYNGE